ncbi:50S ribosomal protein L23 [Candidatus Nanosalina sp. VS9-1]|uniref:50S ribosomal protein L23 n=1 Tax=Candidatus Nanosalina sp. VS9-1 TaxID=3388566 RepID=UPI0039DF6E75
MNEQKALEIIKNPHITEQAMDMVDEENKIVLIVDLDADKNQIEDAVEMLFDVTVKKVNTSITPQNEKKAYVKLDPSDDAMDVATELGMI